MKWPLLSYIRKKVWTRGISLRFYKNEAYIYYSISILMCGMLIAGLLMILSPKQVMKIKQERKEVKRQEKSIPEEINPNIRVVLMNSGFKTIFHSEVKVQKGGEIVTYRPDDPAFEAGTVTIEPDGGGRLKLLSVKRGYKEPSYRGRLELFCTENGIVVVNELPLEEYLCGVVPSEMPASYEIEALKTQAVCARSFAYNQIQTLGYPDYGAHVDDSTSYQVYGNSKEQESTNRAVKETAGEKLWYKGNVATTYYYSTSCGKTTSVEAWGSSPKGKNGYLKSVEVSSQTGVYEEELPWYRWTANIKESTLSRLICENTKKDIGSLKDVQITKRGPGDVALELKAVGEKGSVTVKTENKIRRALGGKGYEITKQDGTVTKSSELLPSAFFTIEKQKDTYVIAGGGFGHGIGMSQNGANEMAKEGKTYKEILQLFYQGAEVKVS